MLLKKHQKNNNNNGTDEPVCRNRDTDVENKCMDTEWGRCRGVGGGGVMNWEIGIDIYTLICIKLITNKNLLYKKINKIQKFKKNILSADKIFKNPKQ